MGIEESDNVGAKLSNELQPETGAQESSRPLKRGRLGGPLRTLIDM